MIRRYCGTDFADSEFSIRAAIGTELAQKQTKATKKNSSFVSFVLFCSKKSVLSVPPAMLASVAAGP